MMTIEAAGIPHGSLSRARRVFWLCSKAAASAMCLLLLSTVPVVVIATRAHAQVNDQSFTAEANRQWELEKKILRKSCELTSEQDGEVTDLNEFMASQIKATFEKLTDKPIEFRLGARIMRQPSATTAQYRAALDKLSAQYREKLSALLSADQRATYEAEQQARADFRRQAHVECLATLIEQKLDLNDEQRKKLVSKLSGYDLVEKLQMSFYLQNESYLPSLPEALLTDVLDKVQLTRYRNFAKTNVVQGPLNRGMNPFE